MKIKTRQVAQVPFFLQDKTPANPASYCQWKFGKKYNQKMKTSS